MTKTFKANKKSLRELIAIFVVLVMIGVGTYLLIATKALSPYISTETESGTLGGSAAQQSDTNASGGKYVQLGSGTMPMKPGLAKAATWQTDNIRKANGGNFDVNNANVIAAITKDATDMEAAGVKWTRRWLNCGNSVADINKVTQIFAAHGIKPLYLINCGQDSSAANETKLANWLLGAVQSFKSQGLHFYEIGNEVNLADSWTPNCKPGTTPSQDQADIPGAVASYAIRLQNAYTIIHQNDPQAFVSSAGLSYASDNYSAYCARPFNQYISEFVKAQYHLWDYMDCMGIHPYGGSAGQSIGRLNNLKNNYMSQNATLATKPFCITEIGYWTTGYTNTGGHIGGSEDDRAAAYVTLMDALKNYGISTPIFWYTWYDHTQPAGFGIVHWGGFTNRTYLPIYNSVKNYTSF